MNFTRLAFGLLLLANMLRAAELVRLDEAGVVRWTADNREVALFGANYSLASSCDYRAAGYVHADRKKLVEQDMAHFARMGWDGMRLCLWGDWENSDKDGNLMVNDHLDVMDYAIAEAKKRGIYILFSPITTYAAWWPDGNKDEAYAGFSRHFDKAVLGTDPAAIAAQCNYLKQMLNHVNPYTGVALKDEPQIIFIEMINEPHHHPEDQAGSVNYVNALANAVRSTGCSKILFHNVSQDMRIVPAVRASTVPGVTFAWYPTGLNVGHTLVGSYLRSVDDFAPMHRDDLRNAPKIVYEFDSPDMNSGYMYPAMARAFRGVGAQFATMFSYDMLATAPYNLGWQTHFLNLVYSPKKALSAVIAAEVMRHVPRYSEYGSYPANTRFGPFCVSAEEDSSEMVTDEIFLTANDTPTVPPTPGRLRRIAGTGSSPVVNYEGNGAYFLDQLADGVWRLELYPDAIAVADPFAQYLNYRTPAIRLVAHEWPMTVRLPGLGESFTISPLNEGNTRHGQATKATFVASPGVYLLSRVEEIDRAKLPARIGFTGLTEFVCPSSPSLPVQMLPETPQELVAGQPATFAVQMVDTEFPAQPTLHLRSAGSSAFKSIPLTRKRAYRYEVQVPATDLPASAGEFYFTARSESGEIRFPTETDNILTTRVIAPPTPLRLFNAAADIPALVYTRIGDTVRRGIFKTLPATDVDPAALRLMLPLSMDQTLDDYTASLAIKNRVQTHRAQLPKASALRIRARSSTPNLPVRLTLVETDGTSWAAPLNLSTTWRDLRIPLHDLEVARGVKLPLGYPERWNYWIEPAAGRGGAGDSINPFAIEHLQISLRPEKTAPRDNTATDAFVDFATIEMTFE